MEKKLKQVIEGMGFICETLEEKKRIWKRLTEAGYPMVCKWEDALHGNYGIRYDKQGNFGSVANHLITDPLNESDFFDEWTPKAGEWVDVSDNGIDWYSQPKQYLCAIDNVYLCVEGGESFKENNEFSKWQHIRQIKPETMTLQEVREALGKPNLIITE